MAGERRLPGNGFWGMWTQGTRGWKAGMDENLLRLSALVQGAVTSRTAAVPASPADGSIYVVPSGTNAHKIAVRDAGAWTYLDPRPGTRLYVADTGTFAYFDGATWTDEEAGEVFTFLGLQDTPDAFGAPGQVVAVNADGDGLEFITPSAGGGGAKELPALTNNEGKVLAVNADGTGVEWIEIEAGEAGLADAPSDGKTYARKDGAWATTTPVVKLTKAQYAALATKDANTLYAVVG